MLTFVKMSWCPSNSETKIYSKQQKDSFTYQQIEIYFQLWGEWFRYMKLSPEGTLQPKNKKTKTINSLQIKWFGNMRYRLFLLFLNLWKISYGAIGILESTTIYVIIIAQFLFKTYNLRPNFIWRLFKLRKAIKSCLKSVWC